MNEHQPVSFFAQAPPRQDSQETLYANGIFADTGLPLCQLDTATVARMALGQPVERNEQLLAQAKKQATQPRFGPVGTINPSDLAEAGWGIVFHSQANQEVKHALQPLIEHRRREARDLCRVFEHADGYQPGETCSEWLARHGVGMWPVAPPKGVPFYLMLVGSPEEIPFEFQYLLDIYWAVGRLHFDDPDDYRRYADSVVSYEQAERLSQTRSVAVFATRHDFDRATQMFGDEVAVPLTQRDGGQKPLGERQKFRLQPFIGDSATKEMLTCLLRGKAAGGPPALLFTGSHGMGFRADDPRLSGAQGALVCQDWAGWGEIGSDDWFEASDLPSDAQVHGLIHFFFACYGAGCPQFDDFVRYPDAQPGQIAPRPLVARLPQKLLAHPNGGALAALGHVDRAWSYSFHSSQGGTQLQGFRDVMDRLLGGERLGQATDQFDVRRAALSSELTDMLRDVEYGKQTPDREIANLWIARNDARNYVVLGDPAVRLRVEDLVDRPAGCSSSSMSSSATASPSGAAGRSAGPIAAGQVKTAQTPAEAIASSDVDQPDATQLDPTAEESPAQQRRANTVTERSPRTDSFDLGNRPGTSTFDPELANAWKEHIKHAYERNELMFDQLLKSFMKPYWTTVWMYRILFGVGIVGFIAAAVLGVWKGIAFGGLFGGLSAVSFLGYFIGRPLRSLEQNLLFITWLGLIYNTYWVRLAYSLNEPTAREDIPALQEHAAKDLERLIDKHSKLAAGRTRSEENMETEEQPPREIPPEARDSQIDND